jgi:hypothetical protein
MFTREVKKGVFLITLALLFIIRDISFVPISIKVFLHIFLGMTVVVFLVTTYKYYGSLIEMKKTILTYLMRTLAIIFGITVVWYNIAAIVLEFPDMLQPLFEKSPDLTCSILRAENVTPLIVQGLFLVLYFKAYATFQPNEYLNMNHDKAYKYAIIGFVTFTAMEQLSVYLWFGTLCVNSKINHLTISVGIDVPGKEFKRAPPLFSIHCVFLLIAGLMYACLRQRKQKTKRKIVPTKIETPNINIMKRLTPPSQDNTSIFTNLSCPKTTSASIPLAVVTNPSTHKLYLVQEASTSGNNGTETGNQFEGSIIIKPQHLTLNENSEDPHCQIKNTVETNTLRENHSDTMTSEADTVTIGFSICACIIIATLCIFFATSKLSFVANLLHIFIALAIHLSAISLVLLSDEILDYMIRKFSNLA